MSISHKPPLLPSLPRPLSSLPRPLSSLPRKRESMPILGIVGDDETAQAFPKFPSNRPCNPICRMDSRFRGNDVGRGGNDVGRGGNDTVRIGGDVMTRNTGGAEREVAA